MNKPSQLFTVFLWIGAFGICLGATLAAPKSDFVPLLVSLGFLTCGGAAGAIIGRHWQGLFLGGIVFIVLYIVMGAMVYFSYEN